MIQSKQYDIIVIGAGHAGCEAALAASRMGCSALLVTMKLDNIALMSCNPAVGGLAKSQLVKEIDALGGQMAKTTDATCIQFRMLNTSKGPAVWASRAQVDRQRYRLHMKSVIESQKNLDTRQARVSKVIIDESLACAVMTDLNETFFGKAIIVTPGTFLNGLIHIGLVNFSGGRMGDEASADLSNNLKELGFKIGRFKTGTCPRLDGRTIDFSVLCPQYSDENPFAFSFSTDKITNPQIPCYITFTNEKTHKIIKDNLGRSPLYTGVIKAQGVRYCPSIEDKIVKFPDRTRHHIFLEPEGLNTFEYYPNGLSTSLPVDVQLDFLHSIEGLKDVKITRPGYGIEHDYSDPTQLLPTLETKLIKNLFFAGQINGTTGYEEAAAQGLIAGINAALTIKDRPPLILDRSEGYIGVLIDDLVTKGTNEPYRMFTSRAEYRLILREDNADLRLRHIGSEIGLVCDEDYKKTLKKKENIEKELKRLSSTKVPVSPIINSKLADYKTATIDRPISLEQLLKRPQISYSHLMEMGLCDNSLTKEERLQVEIQIKYKGFIQRQVKDIERFKKIENINIPQELDFSNIPGLSREVKEKLFKFRPINLGQASRISGITPAAIGILMVYLKKYHETRLLQ